MSLSKKIISSVLEFFLSADNSKSLQSNPKKILIVRQHNQFGDLLASVSLFRAVKETYPESELTVIASPSNYYAVHKNKFIDELFVFDKKKLLSISYIKKFELLLKKGYDLTVIPATVAISKTSVLIGALSKSSFKIGPASLSGKKNDFAFMLNKQVELDWRKYPDAHVSDFGLEILRPIGIDTKDFTSSVNFDITDTKTASDFLSKLGKGKIITGLHVGAGKPPNRWAIRKFIKVAEYLREKYNAVFYLTGSNADMEEINFFSVNTNIEAPVYMNKSIPELAAVISRSDLFITNDTGVMHVAGTTGTPQISIFGPTNPHNWAPIGKNKYFIRKSDLINDIEPEDVIKLCDKILESKNETE